MNTYIIDVIRLKTAKMLISRCYEADKSSTISSDGLAVHGNSIDALATKTNKGYNVIITSTVLEESTLRSLKEEVFAALNAHKSTRI